MLFAVPEACWKTMFINAYNSLCWVSDELSLIGSNYLITSKTVVCLQFVSAPFVCLINLSISNDKLQSYTVIPNRIVSAYKGVIRWCQGCCQLLYLLEFPIKLTMIFKLECLKFIPSFVLGFISLAHYLFLWYSIISTDRLIRLLKVTGRDFFSRALFKKSFWAAILQGRKNLQTILPIVPFLRLIKRKCGPFENFSIYFA